MAISKIADLDPALPEDDDNISEGAFRIREIREALLSQFPGLVQSLDRTVTDAWLNQLSTKLQVVGGQLDAKGNRLLNLADGVSAQDAVTYKQLSDLETRISSLENDVKNIILAVNQQHPGAIHN